MSPAGWRRWLAVSIGFGGVLFMLRPGSVALQWAIIFPLGAAVCGGLRDLITRRIAGTETTVAVLAATTTVVLLAGLATLPFTDWVPLLAPRRNPTRTGCSPRPVQKSISSGVAPKLVPR